MAVAKIDGMVDTNLISRFVSEWKNSGMKGRNGKPSFSFECIGLKAGVKLYCAGNDKAIGEVAERPEFVKTNRVIIYSLEKEFASLEEAEFEYSKSIQKTKKRESCTGWRFFRVRFDKAGKTVEISIRGLWDLYPDIEKGIQVAIEKPVEKPASKSATKSATAAKLSEKDARIAELEKQIAELSKK